MVHPHQANRANLIAAVFFNHRRPTLSPASEVIKQRQVRSPAAGRTAERDRALQLGPADRASARVDEQVDGRAASLLPGAIGCIWKLDAFSRVYAITGGVAGVPAPEPGRSSTTASRQPTAGATCMAPRRSAGSRDAAASAPEPDPMMTLRAAAAAGFSRSS